MSRASDLINYVGDLRDWLVSPEVAAQTEVKSAVRLYGGDLGTLTAECFGVALLMPMPTYEQRQSSGESALHRWNVSIVIRAPQMATREQSMIYALERLAVVRKMLAANGSHWHQLEPATPLWDMIEVTASSTIVALDYELNWPI